MPALPRNPSNTPEPPVPPSAPVMVSLCQLETGARARVHATDLHCDDCELLRAMGLTEQCELRVCRAGEPCIVEVESTRLGIARSVSRKIIVSLFDRA